MSGRTKGVDAPGPRGATTENIVQYLRKEQRSGTGCSDGRLQRDFGDATLAGRGAAVQVHQAAQAREALALELPHTLPADAQDPPDLGQGPDLPSAQPVVHREDVFL